MAAGERRRPTTRVAILDDQQMFVVALQSLLEIEDEIVVVDATTSPSATEEIATDADVALTRELRRTRPARKVIVISGRTDAAAEAEALDAGAAAFLLKAGLESEVAAFHRARTSCRSRRRPQQRDHTRACYFLHASPIASSSRARRNGFGRRDCGRGRERVVEVNPEGRLDKLLPRRRPRVGWRRVDARQTPIQVS